MSSLEWSRLIREQDSVARSQDLRQKQRHNHHKLLYKHDLENMIAEQKSQLARQRQEERQFYQHMYRSLDHGGSEEEQQRHSRMVKESSEYNHSVGQQRRQRAVKERLSEKEMLQGKFRTLQSEMQSEKEQELGERLRRKQQLAQVYESEIARQSSQRQLERLENERFERAAYELQLRREKERAESINKIRHGFGQNKETYGVVSAIYQHSEQDRKSFLQKMARSGAVNPQSGQLERKREVSLSETIETSKFNKQAFMDRQKRKRQMQLRELEEEQGKIVRLEQEVTQQAERERRRREGVRNELKAQLETQIEDELERRWRGKRMSEQEGRMNAGGQAPMLPGLSVDYKERRREEILDSFMRGQRSVQIQARP